MGRPGSLMSLPDPARHARDAAEAIGASFEDLDDGGGYLFRISRGGRSVLAGAGTVAVFPVNSATAVSIARDKAHTKTVLRSVGLPVIEGGLFFAHKRRSALREPGREVEDAVLFANSLGYPVFCKPNSGARGNLAEIISSAKALRDYAARLSVEFEAFLVEPVVSGMEHRILVQDGRAVFHAVKAAPHLTGDGVSTIAVLLQAANARLAGTGISATPLQALADAGVDIACIPPTGTRINLPGRRNLSSEGDIAHFSTEPPPALRDLAVAAARAVGLRIAGVDLFDLSPGGDGSDLVVLEINGNPGVKTAELAGRYDLVLEIWTTMLRELLET